MTNFPSNFDDDTTLPIINDNLKAGIYRLNFDALNFPSGVYFYSMTSVSNKDNSAVMSSKKMILIK